MTQMTTFLAIIFGVALAGLRLICSPDASTWPGGDGIDRRARHTASLGIARIRRATHGDTSGKVIQQ